MRENSERRDGVEGGLELDPGAGECELRNGKWKLRKDALGEWRSFEFRERGLLGVGGDYMGRA